MKGAGLGWLTGGWVEKRRVMGVGGSSVWMWARLEHEPGGALGQCTHGDPGRGV